MSMTRTGNPYENAMMESFFKTLKYEVYLWEYESYQDVVTRLPLLKRSIIRECFIRRLVTCHQRISRDWCLIETIMDYPARPS